MIRSIAVSLLLLGVSVLPFSAAFSLSDKPVSTLVSENANKIATLRDIATSITSDAPSDDVFYLRYCLADVDDDEMKSRFESTMKWRSGEGKSICDAAKTAIGEATESGGWNNDPVQKAAPFASVVNEYITPSSIVTTTTRVGDLAFCIRASNIDDVELMKKISVEDLSDFFVYCKEVNAAVANMRSVESDRLVSVLTANDLSGVKLVGGEASFRKALSASSKRGNELYPTLSGPSLLLNLPKLLGALAKLFTPLFPAEVRKRIKFEQGPLEDVNDMSEILAGSGDAKKREDFMDSLDELIYS